MGKMCWHKEILCQHNWVKWQQCEIESAQFVLNFEAYEWLKKEIVLNNNDFYLGLLFQDGNYTSTVFSLTH